MKGRGASGDDLFVRAAYDEQRDSEVEYGTSWTVALTTTFQRGVYDLSITVYGRVGPMAGRVLCSYKNSWPNAEAQSFGAFLYQCSHRCARMVEAYALDVGRQESGRLNRA